MGTDQDDPGIAARCCTFCAMALAGAALLSVFVSYGVAVQYAEAEIDAGEVQVLWWYDSQSWGFGNEIGVGFHATTFHARPPVFDQTGELGARGWKTRYWRVRAPFWPACIPFAVAAVILQPSTDRRRRASGFIRLMRRFTGVNAGLVVGLGCVVGLSLLAGLLPESDFLVDVCLRVFVPLTVGGWLAWRTYRWIAGKRRRPPGYCTHCGYNLTGNVSGRCPECGESVVTPSPAH